MALSPAQQLALAPAEARAAFLASLTPAEAEALLYDPEFKLRPDQLDVVRDTTYLHLLLCGRMWGKSEAASPWLAHRAMGDPGEYALVTPREKDAIAVEIYGPSGLHTALPPGYIARNVKDEGMIVLKNGSLLAHHAAPSTVESVLGIMLGTSMGQRCLEGLRCARGPSTVHSAPSISAARRSSSLGSACA